MALHVCWPINQRDWERETAWGGPWANAVGREAGQGISDETIIFIHTGGSPALYAYQKDFHQTLKPNYNKTP